MIQAKNIASREDNFSPDEFKNLTNAHREEEELTNLTAIFKLMDME